VCSHRQLSPQPSAAALTDLYSEDYFRAQTSADGGYADYLRNEIGWRRTARERIRRLGLRSTGASILDVGAACGFFVAEARLAGLAAEGVEISSWAAAWARQHLDVPITTGSIADVPNNQYYDIVTAWEVLEHVSDPADFLKAVASRLKPGGSVLLSTPDYSALVPRLFGQRWIGWQKVPEHLSFFSQQSLRRLLRDVGFRIQSIRYISTHVSLGYLVDRLAVQTLGRSLGSSVQHLPTWTFPFNPGWDLEVVATIN
jgi:2-polyprenyl-3-methyl-5-hydroxy-6-metoxy-1,4-benzoquinol methylase